MLHHQDESNTKKKIIELLQRELKLLHVDVIQMNEDALIQQLAKRKVIYNISRKDQIQLVYSYIALAEYYVSKKYHDAAMKNLLESLNIVQTGDALFLMGQVEFQKNQYKNAIQYFESSLKTQWIQPSFQHKIANRLQCMTCLQKIYFQMKKKQKLLQLAQMKVKETLKQKGYNKKTQNYFLALSLADYALIQQKFDNFQTALQRISQAIALLQKSSEDPQKLLDIYLIKAEIHNKLAEKNKQNKLSTLHKKLQKQVLQKSLFLIQKNQNVILQKKTIQTLQKLVKVNLFF